MYNTNTREATATFGYDYILRQCRLRGRIDSGELAGGYCTPTLHPAYAPRVR